MAVYRLKLDRKEETHLTFEEIEATPQLSGGWAVVSTWETANEDLINNASLPCKTD